MGVEKGFASTKALVRIFLAIVLVAGLLPCSSFGVAYGDELQRSSKPSLAEGGQIDSGNSSSEEEVIGNESGAGEPSSDSPSKGDSQVAAPENPSADDASNQLLPEPSAQSETANSVLEFVYIDQKTVPVGGTQSVVVSFNEKSRAQGAILYYQKVDGSIRSTAAAKAVDGAALFEISFGSADQCGEYNLVKVAWAGPEAGETEIPSDTSTGYSFSVQESVEQDEEDPVTVYSLNDDGSMTQKEDLSSAVSELAEGQGSSSEAANAGIAPLSLDSEFSRSAGNMVVALDAGHGGRDGGAQNDERGLVEKELTLKIAQYCKAELDTYRGVTTYMTRTSNDEYVGLTERVNRAVAAGADLFVSFHINATAGATGFEVWVQNDSTWRDNLHEESSQLGSGILSKLEALGLTNRGNKESDSKAGNTYPDGSPADYLTVLEQSRRDNMPAVLIEHGFIDGSKADQDLLSSESGLRNMGVADAQAIAENYGLYKGAPKNAKISAQAHVSNLGWMSPVYDGEVAGTTGRSLPMEALQVKLENEYANQGSVEMNAHVSDVGWQGWRTGACGTTGQSRAMEAVQIRLTGELAQRYDVWYRVHSAEFGWLGWAKDGESAGSQGYGRAVQAVQVVLADKGAAAPGPTDGAFYEKGMSVDYSAHVATLGWQSAVSDGEVAGTTGRGLAMEALQLGLSRQKVSGSVEMNAHVSDVGWQGWRTGACGTTGQSRAMEAVQIRLTGELAQRYDVWYRVHSAEFGWLGWAKDGESAGSQGYGRAVQAVQVVLADKGAAAPGPTDGAFYEKGGVSDSSAGTPIMGSSKTTVGQMVRCYQSTGHSYPASVYASKGAPTLRDYCQIVYEESRVEGVRAEVLFCQAMKETGWLQFGGAVKADQCNFGGLGATGGSVSGATFSSVREGLRAQVQHLKAYASKDALVNPCVDPRFDLVTRGVAPTLEDLNGRWAYPGNGYGQDISKMIDSLLAK